MGNVAGIDVGGKVKGYHASVLCIEKKRVIDLASFHSVELLGEWLRPYDPQCIAIDGPRKHFRRSGETRLAERQLRALGYRVQWTRLDPDQAPEWMVQSALLWQALEKVFTIDRLFETFPTAASTGMAASEIDLPLNLLAGLEKRATYKDYLDACIAASVALNILLGIATEVGSDPATGEVDEQGPIYF